MLHLPRKITSGVIFILALCGLGLWYILTFSSPVNVYVTDITSSSAVVVWTSTKPTTSNIYYSTNPLLLKLLPLSYPFVGLSRNNQMTVNHRLLLNNLAPNKTYHLAISRWFHFYQTQRVLTSGLTNDNRQKTSGVSLPVINTTLNARLWTKDNRLKTIKDQEYQINGIVTDNKLQRINKALVIAKTVNDQAFSTTTDTKGNFSLKISINNKDTVVFFTAFNGVIQQKNIAVSTAIIKQPVLIRMP